MIKTKILNTLNIIALCLLSAQSFASTPASTTTVNPYNGQPLPTTQQLVNQCENNTDSPNCQLIVQQGEMKFEDQQASLKDQINQTPPANQAPIPDQAGPGSNPTQQPNY